MKAILNETRLWYRDMCDKTNNIKNKSKHINSKTHKHKENFGTIVGEY